MECGGKLRLGVEKDEFIIDSMDYLFKLRDIKAGKISFSGISNCENMESIFLGYGKNSWCSLPGGWW